MDPESASFPRMRAAATKSGAKNVRRIFKFATSIHILYIRDRFSCHQKDARKTMQA